MPAPATALAPGLAAATTTLAAATLLLVATLLLPATLRLLEREAAATLATTGHLLEPAGRWNAHGHRGATNRAAAPSEAATTHDASEAATGPHAAAGAPEPADAGTPAALPLAAAPPLLDAAACNPRWRGQRRGPAAAASAPARICCYCLLELLEPLPDTPPRPLVLALSSTTGRAATAILQELGGQLLLLLLGKVLDGLGLAILDHEHLGGGGAPTAAPLAAAPGCMMKEVGYAWG